MKCLTGILLYYIALRTLLTRTRLRTAPVEVNNILRPSVQIIADPPPPPRPHSWRFTQYSSESVVIAID